MAKHPTSKNRKAMQRKVERFMKDREDLMLAGRIAIIPEGAVRDERVDPRSQEEQRTDSLDRQAILKGWAVSEEGKRKVIERLLEPFYEEPVTMEDKDGNPVVIPPDRQLLKENAKVLVIADKNQWERDHPKEAGQARGSINVSQQVAVGFDWSEVTGESPDPVALKMRELDHAGSSTDLPGSVPTDDGPQDPKEGAASDGL